MALTKDTITDAIARHAELVAIRKDVEAGRRRFAHDGELMLLLEENALKKDIQSYRTK